MHSCDEIHNGKIGGFPHHFLHSNFENDYGENKKGAENRDFTLRRYKNLEIGPPPSPIHLFSATCIRSSILQCLLRKKERFIA